MRWLLRVLVLLGFIQTESFGLTTRACRWTMDANKADCGAFCKKVLQYHGGLIETGENYECKLLLKCDNSRVSAKLIKGKVEFPLFEGVDTSESYLKICDRFVEKIFGTRGSFCSELVFISDASGHPEIYTSDFLFTRVTQWTRDRSVVLHPRWHPKGSYIVYTSYRSGYPDVYRLSLKDKKEKCLASYKGINGGACFSPSGDALVMILTMNKVPQLCLCDVEGRNVRALTKASGIKSAPVWLDEKNIIFSWANNGPSPQLFQINVERADVVKLPIAISQFADEACVSKDGERLFFTGASMKKLQLACLDFRTHQAQFITQGPQDYVEPACLADGRHVICTEKSNASKRLVLCDTVTKRIIPLPCGQLKNTYQADALNYDSIN